MSDRSLRLLAAALAVVGSGIAAYLVVERYTGGVISCTSGGCETVQTSGYAELAGIPVAAIGLAAYLAILMLAFSRAEAAGAVQLAIALAGVAFSAYLLYVQVVRIHAICDWCVANDVVIGSIAAVSLLRLWQQLGGLRSVAGDRSRP